MIKQKLVIVVSIVAAILAFLLGRISVNQVIVNEGSGVVERNVEEIVSIEAKAVKVYESREMKAAKVNGSSEAKLAITSTDDFSEEVISQQDLLDLLRGEEELVEMPMSDMLMLIGDEEGANWQAEYDKAEYEPHYDDTWRDDLMSRSYELINSEKYSGLAKVSDYRCEGDSCQLEVGGYGDGKFNIVTLSDFVLDLKRDPSIIKSGKKRNVYITSDKPSENGLYTLLIKDEG